MGYFRLKPFSLGQAALGLLLLASTHAQAVDLTLPSATRDEEPIVSELGRRRIQKNLSLLMGSIKDLKFNLEASRHNIETIRLELGELKQLGKEHNQLKDKYNGYIKFAQGELKKNDDSVRELASWEKKQAKADKEADSKDHRSAAKVGQVKREIADRNVWKADALAKVARVTELIRGLDRNLKEIEARSDPLRRQLATWKSKQEEYQLMLEKMTKKHSELSALARR